MQCNQFTCIYSFIFLLLLSKLHAIRAVMKPLNRLITSSVSCVWSECAQQQYMYIQQYNVIQFGLDRFMSLRSMGTVALVGQSTHFLLVTTVHRSGWHWKHIIIFKSAWYGTRHQTVSSRTDEWFVQNSRRVNLPFSWRTDKCKHILYCVHASDAIIAPSSRVVALITVITVMIVITVMTVIYWSRKTCLSSWTQSSQSLQYHLVTHHQDHCPYRDCTTSQVTSWVCF